MNSKMTTNSQLLVTESKEQSKQPEQEQNHRYGGLTVGTRKGENGGKAAGIKKYKCVGTTFKYKERILKAAREKQLITYKGALISLLGDFSTETLQAIREWHKIIQVMKSKELQPRLLYPARLSFKMEGKIKCFPDKRRLKEYISTKPAHKIC